MNKKISVCIICKNEQDKISQCLESVAWADEIVIVDSGSTDATIEIAKQFTDKIFSYNDWPGFGLQRQRAEQHARNDWVLAIDCDEVISAELRLEIESSMDNANNNDVFFFNRLTNFCGQFIYHSGWYPDRVARIYNKSEYQYNDNLVHESVSCHGSHKVHLKGVLHHYQYDNFPQYIQKRNGYASLSAEGMQRKGKTCGLLKASGSAMWAFFRHFILKRGFLDGKLGFVIAVVQMQYTFNKYLFLWIKK